MACEAEDYDCEEELEAADGEAEELEDGHGGAAAGCAVDASWWYGDVQNW